MYLWHDIVKSWFGLIGLCLFAMGTCGAVVFFYSMVMSMFNHDGPTEDEKQLHEAGIIVGLTEDEGDIIHVDYELKPRSELTHQKVIERSD